MTALRRAADGSVPAPLPADEAGRLDALGFTGVMDTAPEQVFDDVVHLASLICGTPIALISLVDEQRQWFKARVGLGATETPRDHAFCAHAILEPEVVMEVNDARADPRFASNPLVVGGPDIRFYAGAPIVTADGHALGTVCAIDQQPRRLEPAQREALQALARQTARLLEWRRLALAEAAQLRDEVSRQRERLLHTTAMATHGLALKAYIDRDHRYRYVNGLYLQYWAQQREAIEGWHVADLLGPAVYAERVKPLLERAFAGETVQYEARFEFPGAGTRHMRVEYIPVREGDGKGAPVGVVVRSQDVSDAERARAELATVNEQLRQRDRARQRFVQMISHDIREPVNSICNFAGLLQEDHAAVLDAQGRRALDFVQRGGERLRTLLDDLLRHVQLEDDGAIALRAPVDLQQVMADVLADLDDSLQRQQARLRGRTLPVVQGDATLLRLLLQNLVSNALKYHAPGVPPVVDWGADREDGGWAVWVQDEGIGIAPEQQPRLFAAFSRLVSRRQFEGTGLGLASCQRIAELHGGRVSLHSVPGQGSRFTLHLPDAEGAPAGETP